MLGFLKFLFGIKRIYHSKGISRYWMFEDVIMYENV